MAAEIYKVRIYKVSVKETKTITHKLAWEYNRREDAMDSSTEATKKVSKEFLIGSVDISKAISQLNEELKLVKELAKAHPALRVDESALKVDMMSNEYPVQYATVYDFNEDENYASYETAYVVVHNGMRGQYVWGKVNYLSFEMEQVKDYKALNGFSKAACEVVEQYLDEQGVLDSRYSILGAE